MNHIFSPYIGKFMDVYLDDIVVYSDSLEEHVRHCKLIFDILRREKLYLSEGKIKLLMPEIKILGRVIDDAGIRMDPAKVDSVLNWKTPTSKDLLSGFLGSVGYLADDIARVRVPMGILHGLTGVTVPFRWSDIHQRAFEEIKQYTHDFRNHSRVPLSYAPEAPQINIVTDASLTGLAGVVSQGDDWKTARVAAFFSAKLNPAQQNYAVHELEMFAGVETMKRHRDILQGCRFKWYTDHKGLIHLLNQKNLSGRQARWMESISEFDFEVVYVQGTENVLTDALSRMYSNDAPGTVRSLSEYSLFDETSENTHLGHHAVSMPVLVGMEADAMGLSSAAARVGRPRKASKPRVEVLNSPRKEESSAEFARRMRERVFIRGPRDPLEGENSLSSALKATLNATDRAPKETAPNNVSANPGNPEKLPDMAISDTNHKSDGNLELPDKDILHDPIVAPSTDGLLVDVVNAKTHFTGGIDVIQAIREHYAKDPVFRAVQENPKSYRNFEVDVKTKLMFMKQHERRVLCVPNAIVNGRSVREILISEAHSLLAHLGASKTINYLRDQVWWKEMLPDIKTYCDSCRTCRLGKSSNQKPYGLLKTLEVPSHPWESIGIDFVGPLPESKDRNGAYDSITVIICRLTGMVHLVPSRTSYKARQVAELVFAEVYKHHGLPKTIVSDRDVLFTSEFWKHLNDLIGTKLKMSSAYHPESDGSTERANRTVNQMIRQCINPNQKDWCSKLPGIEFAINSARSDSTGYSPFFLNHGRMPRSMIWDWPEDKVYPGVRTFALKIKQAVMEAHDCILAARVKQTRAANRKRQPAPFIAGDLVYVSTKNISFPKGLARKFIPKYMGPYKIVKDFSGTTFKVDLPARLKQRGVHDDFHASLLRIHVPNDDRLFPGRLDTQFADYPDIAEGEWAVDRIISHIGSRDNASFQILWKSGDVTWLPYEQATHLNALPQYFELLGIENVSELAEGAGQPPSDDPQVFLGMLVSGIIHDVRRAKEAEEVVAKEAGQRGRKRYKGRTMRRRTTHQKTASRTHTCTPHREVFCSIPGCDVAPHTHLTRPRPARFAPHYIPNHHRQSFPHTRPMSTPSTAALPSDDVVLPAFTKIVPGVMSVRDEDADADYTITRDMFHLYVGHDTYLREGVTISGYIKPFGYDSISSVVNSMPGDARMATELSDGQVTIPTGRSRVTVDMIFGPPPKTPFVAMKRSRDDSDVLGLLLDPKRQKTVVTGMLDALEAQQRKADFVSQKIDHRRAGKDARLEEESRLDFRKMVKSSTGFKGKGKGKGRSDAMQVDVSASPSASGSANK